jgi:ATP/maltotriose-dependent transcriptional regulator MalT
MLAKRRTMAQLAERFVGRAEELGSLTDLVAQLGGGRASAIDFVGDPGIGKSRLLAELAALADARGHLVLTGSASEVERDVPFAVFVDALDEYVQGLDSRRLDELADDVRAELGSVFPSLARLGNGHVVTLQHERYRAHRAVRELLELLGTTTPLVLVLDDLHWADSASVELLGTLLRRLPAANVLIVMAGRQRQLPERLGAALERAHRAGTLTRAELGALTHAETCELLGDGVADAEATALYEESGGNPFYLEQLARALGRAAGPARSGRETRLADIGIPPSVAAALTAELALLPQEVRRVLEGAAVAGDPFEPELAAAAASASDEVTLEALDDLLRLDLVRSTDVPRRFRFRHPLVRRAVYESTPGAWRLGAHERSSAALAARGASATSRAHHVEQSARTGDAAAVAVLCEAGEAAARRAPESAARWFAGALRLIPDDAPAQQRVELLLARAAALAATGRFTESHEALLDGVALASEGPVELRLKVTTACAAVEHLLGRHEKAHARLLNALNGLPEGSPESVALMIELAVDGLYRAEYDSMREWAERARDAAGPLEDRPLTAAAVAALALAGAFAGRVPEADRHRSEAAALVDALPDAELALRLDAAANLAAAELYLDRYEEAVAHAERALRIGRATGQSDIVPVLFPTLGSAARMRGRLAESGELLDGAVEAARLSGHTQGLAWNLLNRSHTALQAGDVELALEAAHESNDLLRGLDHGLVSAYAGVALAGALLASGDSERAVEVLVSSAGGDELPFIPGGWRAKCLDLLTRCWLALGCHGEAERAAACAEARAEAVPLQMAVAMAGRARAAVLFESEPAVAAERALASAAAAEKAGVPIEAALSRALAGRALARAGEHQQAAAELERAAAELHSHGALRDRDEAERELRKLGRRTHRRIRTGATDGIGIASLTARELEVARLVVDRKTNPEIATALFLSQKTVESHIRNMFYKLGVASRVELARAVVRADRDAGTS